MDENGVLSLPDDILLSIFTYLDVESAARVRAVCKTFAAAASETLWRQISRRELLRHHPSPLTRQWQPGPHVLEALRTDDITLYQTALTSPPAVLRRLKIVLPPEDESSADLLGERHAKRATPVTVSEDVDPEEDGDISEDEMDALATVVKDDAELARRLQMLRIAHRSTHGSPSFSPEQELVIKRVHQAVEAERSRIAAVRESIIDTFRTRVRELRSFRKAFPETPWLRHSGIYCLRHEYVRKAVRDIWHTPSADILKVVYHRAFAFLPDGKTVVYAMVPGELSETVKELRRMLTAGVSAAAAVVAATPEGARLSVPTRHARADAFLRQAAAVSTDRGGVGQYRIEGRKVRASIDCQGRATARWSLLLHDAPPVVYYPWPPPYVYLANNRLTVEGLTLVDTTRMVDGRPLTQDMVQVEDQDFEYMPVKELTSLLQQLHLFMP